MEAPTGEGPHYELSERRMRRLRRAEAKTTEGKAGRAKKASRKKPMKQTTASMEIAQSKGGGEAVGTTESGRVEASVGTADAKITGGHTTADAIETAPTTNKDLGKEGEGAVNQVVADLVASVVMAGATVLEESDAPPNTPSPCSGIQERSKKRRRAVLQDDSDDLSEEDQGDGNALSEDTAAPKHVIPVCVLDADPNVMDRGADHCTGLNSDEDPELPEEPEDEDNESWNGDWDIGELSGEDTDEEYEELPDSIWASVAKDKELVKEMRHSGWEYDPSQFGPDPTYAGLYDGPYGPSDSAMSVADDPLALLFYFMPPKLWSQIAVESNRYHTQSIPLRARAIRSQQIRTGGTVEELGGIRSRLAGVARIEAWEVLRVVALLIGRMLMPIRKGIAAHWSTKQVGALPTNRFNLFMSKHRFFHIMGYLHFSNNKSPQASVDRAWKIRPVVDVLQRTFARGYQTPPVISFDEATLPSRSRYNPTRQFNKDKPHKWGTKVFVAACAENAYILRIEVYCGAKSHLRTPIPKDNNTGEAAVLRNLNALCPPSSKSPWRLVVTDRFYTSVKLVLELLHRRMYLTGTIQTDRSGYAKGVITTKQTKTVNKKKVMVPPQGTIKLAQNKRFPQITAAMWMDRNPVHLLSSGGSRAIDTVSKWIDNCTSVKVANIFWC
ncbi:hypothetical protein DVH05_028602 [Phytophthora capsici]|nr:hypothetical protein DVH05_028602 [Phytophthora capsici]